MSGHQGNTESGLFLTRASPTTLWLCCRRAEHPSSFTWINYAQCHPLVSRRHLLYFLSPTIKFCKTVPAFSSTLLRILNRRPLSFWWKKGVEFWSDKVLNKLIFSLWISENCLVAQLYSVSKIRYNHLHPCKG